MVAIAIQLSACGDNPFNSSTKCDVSDIGALAGRNLSECNLVGANLTGADLTEANLGRADLKDADLTEANTGVRTRRART